MNGRMNVRVTVWSLILRYGGVAKLFRKGNLNFLGRNQLIVDISGTLPREDLPTTLTIPEPA